MVDRKKNINKQKVVNKKRHIEKKANKPKLSKYPETKAWIRTGKRDNRIFNEKKVGNKEAHNAEKSITDQI